MSKPRRPSAWSKLTPRGRARLKASGVKPVSYNAWARKTARQRAKLDRDAYVRGQTSKQKQISVRRKLARYLAMGPAQRTVYHPIEGDDVWEMDAGDLDDFWRAYDAEMEG